MARRYRKFPKELVDFEPILLADQRRIYGGQRWIVATLIVTASESMAAELIELGASSTVAMGGFGVAQPFDAQRDVHPVTLIGPPEAAPHGFLDTLRLTQAALCEVDQSTQDTIDAWDPDGRARVIVDFSLGDDPVARRATFGARRRDWDRFDDKLNIESVWEAAGIDTMPSVVVDLSDEHRLLAAHQQLATPLGTVWAADNAKGWHGGASGTAWVPNRDAVTVARNRWLGEHQQVRVQPFVEGVPCSVHAMVLADRTLAFRPTEMVVLRNMNESSLVYCRSATYWDPPRVDRARMRAAAIAVGNELRRLADFRGVFTLDGVMTVDGFRPTEINPRWGAALPMRLPTESGGELSVFLTHAAVVAGAYDELDGNRFERWVLFRLDEQRNGRCFFVVPSGPPERQTLHLDVRGEPVEDDSGDEALSVDWSLGLGGLGQLTIRFGPAMPVGPSVAPAVCRAIAKASQHWDFVVPELQPALDVDNPTGQLSRVKIGG